MQRLVLQANIDLKSNIKKLLFDDDFINDVKECLEVLNPISALINRCQEQNFSIAGSAEEWLQLALPCKFKECLNKRKAMALYIFSLTANFFHPAYCGKLFDDEHSSKVNDFLLEKLNREALIDLHAFINSEGIFKILEEKQLLPIVFWSKVYPTAFKNSSVVCSA